MFKVENFKRRGKGGKVEKLFFTFCSILEIIQKNEGNNINVFLRDKRGRNLCCGSPRKN